MNTLENKILWGVINGLITTIIISFLYEKGRHFKKLTIRKFNETKACFLERNFPKPDVKYTGKNYITLPKISLTQDQQTWFDTVYQAFLRGEQIPAHVLKKDLVKSEGISEAFDYKNIDHRLIKLKNPSIGTSEDNVITLFGIYNADLKTHIPEQLDVIIRYIKQLINYNPHITSVSAKTLQRKLGISERDISTAIILGRDCKGMHYLTGGGNKDPSHYLGLVVSINLDSDIYFKFYDAYENIQKSLEAAYQAI